MIVLTVKGSRKGDFSKDKFDIDVDNAQVTCPAGHTTGHYTWVWYQSLRNKRKRNVKRFAFDKEVCRACPWYEECVNDKRRRGRFITLHPDETLLQQVRVLEETEYFRETYLAGYPGATASLSEVDEPSPSLAWRGGDPG